MPPSRNGWPAATDATDASAREDYASAKNEFIARLTQITLVRDIYAGCDEVKVNKAGNGHEEKNAQRY